MIFWAAQYSFRRRLLKIVYADIQGGKGSSAVEPCPVCAQPQAELAPLKLPGEQEPEEILELYCNEAMYGFWRLYHHCYDRLRIARNCILEKHSRNGKEMVCSAAAAEVVASTIS